MLDRKPSVSGSSSRIFLFPWTPPAGFSSFPPTVNKAEQPHNNSSPNFSGMSLSSDVVTADLTVVETCRLQVNSQYDVISAVISSLCFSFGLIYCFLGTCSSQEPDLKNRTIYINKYRRICIYEHIYVHICPYTHICTHIHIYIYIHTHTYIKTYIKKKIYIYMYMYTYI